MTRTEDALKTAIDALEEKKGEQIKVIDISKISVMADYFVIASGKNLNQIKAMADEVEEKLSKEGIEPRQIEGANSSGWILMDYRDFIIHIFNEDMRLYYDIERIWSDGIPVDINK
ncbi:MAG: ribosome silencing factor [Lachnospiraceae bacterium]|nr:ribosome silencing factor [Lachnospiraceae bacterium]